MSDLTMINMHTKGVTLIEMILYIAMTSVVLVVSGALSTRILLDNARLHAMQEVTDNANFALGRLSAAIRNAEAVALPEVGTTGPVLSLFESGEVGNALDFSVDSGKLLEQSVLPLTSNQVRVTLLEFQNVGKVGGPAAIRIHLRLQYFNPNGRPEYSIEEDFYTTEVITHTPQ